MSLSFPVRLVTMCSTCLSMVSTVSLKCPQHHMLAPRLLMLGLSAAGVYWAVGFAEQDLRGWLLVYVSALFLARFALMLLVLVPRHVPWWEALCTGCGMAVLPPLFVVAAESASSTREVSWLDGPAMLLYLVGSALTLG